MVCFCRFNQKVKRRRGMSAFGGIAEQLIASPNRKWADGRLYEATSVQQQRQINLQSSHECGKAGVWQHRNQ